MDKIDNIVNQISDRFGISRDELDSFVFTEPNRKHLSFHHSSLMVGEVDSESVGISFAKHKQKWPKLTTGAARVIGEFAKKNFIELTRSEADSYMKRETFDIEDRRQLERCESPGYVIVKYENTPIGVGMLKYDDISAYLCSLYPKNWKKN